MSRIAENLGPGLFDAETIVRAMPDGVPIDVCILFEKLALEVHSIGFTHYSARALAHRIRWHYQIEKGEREFVFNNNWTAPLARWFLKRHPDLPKYFEIRRSIHD